MRSELLDQYESELALLQKAILGFGKRYPGLAPNIGLSQNAIIDPHLAMLIEAVAFLNARTRQKIEDEFPEITQSFLSILFPHYLNPIPSSTVAELGVNAFYPVPASGIRIQPGSELISLKNQTELTFTTGSSAFISPLEIKKATHQPHTLLTLNNRYASSSLILTLQPRQNLSWLEILTSTPNQPVRFFISSKLGFDFELYELIFRYTESIEIQAVLKSGASDSFTIQQYAPQNLIGPALKERLLPFSKKSNPGYGLLLEYFTAPKKFLFVELPDLNLSSLATKADLVQSIEIKFRLKNAPNLRYQPTFDNFRLSCVPIINLFPTIADPFKLDQKQYKYRVIPNKNHKQAEIYSLTEVRSVKNGQPFLPFFTPNRRNLSQRYYLMHRNASSLIEDFTDISLSFVDQAFNVAHSEVDTIAVKTLCSNNTLPSQAQWGYPNELKFSNLANHLVARLLTHPTPRYYPDERRGSTWRFISHLLLNHLSLESNNDETNLHAFKELLQLYEFKGIPVSQNQIEAIREMKTTRSYHRLGNVPGTGFVPGITTTLTLNESNFEEHNSFLFAQVLEEFLANYCHINTYHQLRCQSSETGEWIGVWPPRCGQTIIF